MYKEQPSCSLRKLGGKNRFLLKKRKKKEVKIAIATINALSNASSSILCDSW